jgi:5-methylcytosine-specific restriction protein A
MPKAAPRPCTAPGCSALVYGGGSRCAAHPHETSFASKRRGSRHERGYGTDWDKLRLQVLQRDAYVCQPHLREGLVHTGRIVDHIKNKAEGGTDDPSNLETVCDDYSREKTQAEAVRGRAGRKFGAKNKGPLA